MKNTVQKTSLEAYRNLNPDSVAAIKNLIIETLKVIGSGSSQQIADYCGKSEDKIRKRLSELEREDLIWKPGHRVATKSGNTAFVWTLRGDNQPKTDKEENVFRNQKTSTDFASQIINSTQQTLFT
jgi:predicted ArsR family transcriptional regulator